MTDPDDFDTVAFREFVWDMIPVVLLLLLIL